MLATVVLELFQLLPSSVAATCGERHERKVWRSFDTQQLDNLQDEVSRQKGVGLHPGHHHFQQNESGGTWVFFIVFRMTEKRNIEGDIKVRNQRFPAPDHLNLRHSLVVAVVLLVPVVVRVFVPAPSLPPSVRSFWQTPSSSYHTWPGLLSH